MRALISMLTLTILTTAAWADLDNLRSEAQIAAAAGEVDIATSKLQQILALAPDDGASHYQLAVLLMDNNGDAFDSAQHFERTRDLEYQPLGVAYRLSRLYARAGRDNDALEQLEILAMTTGARSGSAIAGHLLNLRARLVMAAYSSPRKQSIQATAA